MDSKLKKHSPQRDPTTGRFLPKPAYTPYEPTPEIVQGWAKEAVRQTPIAEMGVEMGEPLLTREQRVRWLKPVIGGVILLLVLLLAKKVLALDAQAPTIAGEFEMSCRTRMTALLISAKLEETGTEMTQPVLRSIHELTMQRLSAEDQEYLDLSESVIIMEACRQMWLDAGPTVIRRNRTN